MHGRLKVRTSEEQKAIKLKEQQAKLKLYQTSLETIFSQRENGTCDSSTLALIGKIVCTNPDINTLWNIRREILLSRHRNENGEGEEIIPQVSQDIVEQELDLTEQCLRVNPKSYSAWHHRCWILENCPSPNWQKEVDLCTKYLKLDERNFHCWDYRRFVVSRANISPEDELQFSTNKILQNFSNYSAWHYRSILYKSLSPFSAIYKDELEMVQNAAFTDPNDTSAWFYQRWLLGKREDPVRIILAYLNKSHVAVTTNQIIGEEISPQVFINDENLKINWENSSNNKYSKVWFGHMKDFTFKSEYDVTIKVLHETNGLIDTLSLSYNKDDEEFQGENKIPLGLCFDENNHSILGDQLKSCQELLELEPESKWTILTSALLMRGLGGNENLKESIKLLDLLMKYDHFRTGYYKDLKARWLIEDLINEQMKTGSLFNTFYITEPNIISLRHLEYFQGTRKIFVNEKNIAKWKQGFANQFVQRATICEVAEE